MSRDILCLHILEYPGDEGYEAMLDFSRLAFLDGEIAWGGSRLRFRGDTPGAVYGVVVAETPTEVWAQWHPGEAYPFP